MQRSLDAITLAIDLHAAKEAEREARNRRVKIEEILVATLGFRKAEGQETYRTEGDEGSCTIVCKQPIVTSVDADLWRKIRENLPTARDLMREKFELDVKRARKLQADDPVLWRLVAPCVTRKPGKVSVEIKNIVLVGGR